MNNIVSWLPACLLASSAFSFMLFEFTGINNDDYQVFFCCAVFSLLFVVSTRKSLPRSQSLDGKKSHCFPMIMIFFLLSRSTLCSARIKQSPRKVEFKFFFFNHLTNESCVGLTREFFILFSFAHSFHSSAIHPRHSSAN